MTIAVLGTLDTKGHEHGYVAELIRARGHQTLVIDCGSGDAPQIQPDITRHEVAAAGAVDLAALMERKDRGESVSAMASAAAALVSKLHAEGKIDGIIYGGSGL